jgi:thiol-disulfide isomerase/thioredoxin
VITVSASQSFTAGRVAVAFAYGAGSALVLYALMLGGRRLTGRLARRSGRLQMSMGAIMIVVALAMLGNYDTRFETAIASDLPAFLVDPTRGLETGHAATAQLAALRGIGSRHAGGLRQADAGARLPDLGPAPQLVGTQVWFNTADGRALTLAALRGHIVLVDFWTYSCINCIRTLPYLNAWYAKYRRDGFVLIGVHTPEFPFEHSPANVAQAIAQNGIRYPVVQDNNYATWNAYNNQYWPAEYLIDTQGRIRLADFGEGDYGGKERAIRSLLAQAGANWLGSPSAVHAQQPSDGSATPESYLGAARAARFENGRITPGVHDFGASTRPPGPDQLRYDGAWRITGSSATALAGARVQLNFNARRVFVVMGSPARPRNVAVQLDGRAIPQRLAGSDVHRSLALVSFQRLYRLVELPRVERHVLTIEPAAGLVTYSFTFG